MGSLKIKSIYHFNKNEIEYISEKYKINETENFQNRGIYTLFSLNDGEREFIKKKFSAYSSAEREFSINDNEKRYVTESVPEQDFSASDIQITDNSYTPINYDSSDEIVRKPKKKGFIFAVVAVLAVVGAAAAAGGIVIGNSSSSSRGTEIKASSSVNAEKSSSAYDVQTSEAETTQNIDAQGECGENASYKLIGNTLYIEGTGTVDGNSETATSRFKYLPNEIEAIIISDGIKKAGDYAFDSCGSLKNITVPDSVSEIGLCAFRYCKSLESITIPDTVTKIEDEAFEGCSSLKTIVIPSNVTEINNYSFADCEGLESITIPSSVTYIGDYAFKGCDKLTINGEKGSAAEAYANNRNIKFKSI